MSESADGSAWPADVRRISVSALLDVDEARRQAREMTRRLGFDHIAAEQVALAVTELAMNLVRHAGRGLIVLQAVTESYVHGVRVESHDRGPGIADIDRAFSDGFSTAGGMGSGLPAVRRLMDSVSVESSHAGTHIVATKWNRH